MRASREEHTQRDVQHHMYDPDLKRKLFMFDPPCHTHTQAGVRERRCIQAR